MYICADAPVVTFAVAEVPSDFICDVEGSAFVAATAMERLSDVAPTCAAAAAGGYAVGAPGKGATPACTMCWKNDEKLNSLVICLKNCNSRQSLTKVAQKFQTFVGMKLMA